MTTQIIKFRFRRGVAALWSLRNTVLNAGEPGLETDTGRFKIGDGTTAWNFLNYYVDEDAISAMIAEAIAGVEPGGNTGLSEAQVSTMISEAVGQIVVPDVSAFITDAAATQKISDAVQQIAVPDVSAFITDAEATQKISDAIDGLVVGGGGLSSAQIQAMIDESISAITFPDSMTHAEVATAISDAINGIVFPEPGVSEEEMSTAISDAINGIVFPAPPDLTNYVTTSALSAALAGLNSTYATDAELSSAISSAIAGLDLASYSTDAERDAAISAAISGLNATYATDAELSSAISTALSGLNATYATDAELSSAIASAISGLNATYATDAELASAVSPLLKKDNNGTLANSVLNLIAQFQHLSDGSDQSTWSDMLRFSWKPTTGAERVTSYFNELGEFRTAPGQSNSVPFRVFTKVAPGDAAHTGNVLELQDDRQTRTVLWSVDTTGKVTAPNIGAKVSTGASAPSSPAVGDVWIH